MALVPPPTGAPANAEIGVVDRVTITRTQQAVIHVIRPAGWQDTEIVMAVGNKLPELMSRADWWDAEQATDGVSVAKATDDREIREVEGKPEPMGCLVELGDMDLVAPEVTIESGGAA